MQRPYNQPEVRLHFAHSLSSYGLVLFAHSLIHIAGLRPEATLLKGVTVLVNASRQFLPRTCQCLMSSKTTRRF